MIIFRQIAVVMICSWIGAQSLAQNQSFPTVLEYKSGGDWTELRLPTKVESAENDLVATVDLQELQKNFKTIVEGSGVLPKSSRSNRYSFSKYTFDMDPVSGHAFGAFEIRCKKYTARGRIRLGRVTVRYSVQIGVKSNPKSSVPDITLEGNHKVISKDAIADVFSTLGLADIDGEVDRAAGNLKNGSLIRFRKVDNDKLNQLIASDLLVPKSARFMQDDKNLRLEMKFSPKDETVKGVLEAILKLKANR